MTQAMPSAAPPSTTSEPKAAPRFSSPLDVEKVRSHFPALDLEIHGKKLVYLDNGASSQTPTPVIDALGRAYIQDRANIHRGVHLLSQRATEAYEAARKKVAAFIGAPSEKECIFVRGTTEGLNLVAFGLERARLREGDEVVITGLEHHSNIVPWQMACERSGAKLRVAPLNAAGEITLDAFSAQLSERTKVVAFAHVSNALGTVLPVKEMARRAHEVGAVVVVDGAQAVPHTKVDVVDLGVDFYTFSAHKMYGPTGAGVLWGRRELLEEMPPWQGGGDMIRTVTFEKTTYAPIPAKFEAGTPDITGGIALGAAIDFMEEIGVDAIAAHENALVEYATARLQEIDGLRIIGTAKDKAAVVSFVLDGVHPHDIGTILDREGVAVRTGHHCAQPVMDFFEVPATARASFAAYNTPEEVDALIDALNKAIALLR